MKSENELMIFEGHNVEVFEWEGKVLFNPKHVAECLDISDVNSSIRNFNKKQVIKLKNSDMHEMHIRKLNNAGESFLTESGVYKLIFKSHKEEAEKFQDWVTDVVLPTIRKTGGYVNNADLMVNTYFGALDDNHKGLVKGLFLNIEEQQKQLIEKDKKIEEKQKEIEYKEDVIIGLVDEISLAEKRQILNRVVRKGHGNYQERYSELYKQFELKYHINLNARLKGYNETHKPKVKNKMAYIDTIMNKIPELYEIACKLYENDVDDLVQEMYELNNNKAI